MDINTASLLANQLQTLDPKATNQEALTKQANEIIQKSGDLPLELTAQKTSYSSTPSDAKDVVSQLLGSAISEAKSKSAIYEVLQNNQLFKNMGNFAEDIKSLTNTIKLDSTIAQPLALLQLFAKNIEQIDTKMLQTQIQNSGIFFESKLSNIVTQKGVLQTIESLTSQITSHFKESSLSASPILKDITFALEKLTQLQELSSKEAQSTLKNLLDLVRQGNKQEIASQLSPHKETYQIVQKLDYAIKQMDLVASKADNYPTSMKVDEHFTMQVKVLLEQLKANLSNIGLDDLQPHMDQLLAKDSLLKGQIELIKTPMTPNADTTTIKTAVSQISQLTDDVSVASPKPNEVSMMEEKTKSLVSHEHEPKLAEETTILTATASVQTQSVALPSSAFVQVPQSVEEALKMIAARIKQQITILDPKSIQHADFTSRSSTLDQTIHSLIKPELFVGKAMAQRLSLDPTDVELLSDMKGVLTKLNDALAASPQNKEAYEMTNRLLTQIEYHQLFSYVSSATHLYIPFSWEGLKGGSMMMKQSGTNSFHCQIDLDLEQYGKLNMMLVLSNDKYIDMSVAAQKKELKDKMNTQLPQLKQAFNEVGLVTGTIKMLEYKEVSTVKNDYFKGEQIQFGINFKI